MRMKKEIPTEILQTINALNTVNGGVSEPTLILKQLEDHRAVWLRVPGIDLDKIQVEIRNNVLSITLCKRHAFCTISRYPIL
jgi:HSP20 family molecular chaperone IbpA